MYTFSFILLNVKQTNSQLNIEEIQWQTYERESSYILPLRLPGVKPMSNLMAVGLATVTSCVTSANLITCWEEKSVETFKTH